MNIKSSLPLFLFLFLFLFLSPAYAQVSKHAIAVIGQKDFNSDSINQGGAPSAKTMCNPGQILVMNGKLIIADAQNNRVLIFDSIPSTNNIAAGVVLGQADFTSVLSDRGGSTNANTLDRPVGLATDGIKFFLLDRDNHRVLIFNSLPDSNGASAHLVIGQNNMTDNFYGGESSLNDTANLSGYRLSTGPTGLCYDSTTGKLIVYDSDNDRVLIYNQVPSVNGVEADVVIGQPDFYHNKTNQGSPVNANTLDLNTASGVATYKGKLFVADRQNNRVLIFNSIPASNNAMADVVIGQADFTSKLPNRGGSPSANTLWVPRSVAVDVYGRMYISDPGNARILVYNQIPVTNGASADYVIGQPDFTSNTSYTSDSTFSTIYHILAHEDKLLVSDAPKNRVLVFKIETPLTDINYPVNLQTALNIYPNPNNGSFHLRLNTGEPAVNVRITGIGGSEVYSGSADFSLGEISIDLPGIRAGIYYLTLSNESGVIGRSKMVVIQ